MPNDDLTPPAGEKSAPGTEGAAGATGAEARWQNEAARLRRENTRLQDLVHRATPLVKAYEKLYETDPGKEILRRLEAGEPLTLAQEQKLEAKAEVAGVTTKELKDSIRSVLKEELDAGHKGLLDRLAADRVAAEETKTLEKRAKEELDGFEEVRKHPRWEKTKDTVIALVQAGALDVPEDEPDPYWWLIKQSYHNLVASDPKMLEAYVKNEAKKQNERKAKALASGAQAPASRKMEASEEIPEEIQKIRRIGTGTVGKRF